MTHFATAGADRSPAEAELASALAADAALILGCVPLGLLPDASGHHTVVLFAAVFGIVTDDPIAP